MVQQLGLDTLQRLDTARDRRARSDALVDQMKLSLVNGFEDLARLWPEHFASETRTASEGDDLTNPDVSYDYSGVQWGGSAEMARDAEALSRFLGESTVTVEQGDAPEEGWV